MIKVNIEVRDRDENRLGNSKVYFFHKGESVLEDFGNRVARPQDLYKTYIPDVAEKMGLSRTAKFSWSQKAGCRCGCSPGFTSKKVKGKDVFVTLEGAPKTNYDIAKGADRVRQLVG